MRARTAGTKRDLLMLLATSKLDVVRYEAIVHALWGHDPDGGPSNPINVLKTQLCHLRKALKPFGIQIETVWGIGQRIPKEQRVRALEVAEQALGLCRITYTARRLKVCPHCGRDVEMAPMAYAEAAE